MEPYSQIVGQIIKDQEEIIGPVALEQAQKISGLDVSKLESIKITGNAKDVLGQLVTQYSKLFGRASIEVCREAVRETKSPLKEADLPDILK